MPLDAGAFTKKLQGLQPTTESIQTITNWCLFHKSYATGIVQTWQQLCLAPSTSPTHRLTLLYLANDIIQTTRRTTPLFVQAFQQQLQSTFVAFYKHKDTKAQEKLKVERMIDVWQCREVFGDNYIQQLRSAIGVKQKTKEEALEATNQKKPVRPASNGHRPAAAAQPQRSHSNQQQQVAPASTPAANTSATDAFIKSDDLCSLLLTLEKDKSDDDLIAQLAEPYLSHNSSTDSDTNPAEIIRILKQYESNVQQQITRRLQLKELLSKRLSIQDAILSEAEEQLQQCQSQIAQLQSDGSPSAAKRAKTDDSSDAASADQYNELLRSLSTIQNHVTLPADDQPDGAPPEAADDEYVP